MATEVSTEVSTTTATQPETKRRKFSSIPPRTIAPFTDNQPPVKLLYPLSNYAFAPKTINQYQSHIAKESETEANLLKNGKIYKQKTFKSDQIPNNSLYFKNLKNYNDLYDKSDKFLIPGGYLNHDESENEGAKRILKELFDDDDEPEDQEITMGETVGRWWRTDLKPNVYPYLPRHVTRPKELIKVNLVNLPKNKKFKFPEYLKNFHPYILVDLYDSSEPELKAIPSFLSRFSFGCINDKGEITNEITQEEFKY
ncbi:unnamed protein product [Wickerhamomyces anomalus]